MGKSLVKNAAFNIVYRILNVLFPLVSVAYVSRVLGPDGIGKVGYAQNIVSYFVMFAMLGTPRYGTREIAKCRDNPQALNKLFSELLTINGTSTAICMAVFLIMLVFDTSENTLLYFVCGTEILFNFINIDWFYEGEEEYAYITARSLLVKICSLLLLFLFVQERQDYLVYALIHCLGICGNNLFNIIHAKRKVRFSLRDLSLKPHLKPIIILALSTIFGGLYNKLNVTILGLLETDEVIGFHTNAYKLVIMGTTLVTSVSAVFMPRLSYMYNRQKEQFVALISTGTKIVLLLAVPACVGMAMVANNLVTVVFGTQFQPAAISLQIMSGVIFVMGVGDLLCYQVIISSGNEKLLVTSRIVAGGANVFLNLLLIPELRHVGAAIATVVSELIVNTMLIKCSFAVAKPVIDKHYWFSIIMSTMAIVVVVSLIQHLIIEPLVALVLAVCLGVSVYLAVLLITKNETLISFVGVLKRKKLR